MNRLSLSQLDQQADKYNSCAASIPGIDPFCCRTDWIIPFNYAFTPDSQVFIRQQNDSYIILAGRESSGVKTILTSPESMWGFTSPLVGPESPEMLAALLQSGYEVPCIRHTPMILFGLPDDIHFLRSILKSTSFTHHPLPMEPTLRSIASLESGMDGFLQRRSRKFRANIRRVLIRAAEEGISFSRIHRINQDEVSGIYAEILDIERRSWKGESGEGIEQPPMETFYRLIMQRIAPAGHLRLIIADRDGENIGYIFGALIGRHFRGFQFSFDQRFASLSPGNLLQYRMIEWMCAQGCRRYDLGMHVPYKEKWAENIHKTETIYLLPKSLKIDL